MLPRQARYILSCLCCNGHSLLSNSVNWKKRESFMQRLRSSDPEHLLSHSVLSSYGLFESLALWQLCYRTTSDLGPGELLGFWGSMVFRHAPISWKGWNNNNNKKISRSYQGVLMMISATSIYSRIGQQDSVRARIEDRGPANHNGGFLLANDEFSCVIAVLGSIDMSSVQAQE